MGKSGPGPTRVKKQIDVQFQYAEDLSQIMVDVLSVDGSPLSGQDILDAVAETLLLKWDNYDLDSKPDYDG